MLASMTLSRSPQGVVPMAHRNGTEHMPTRARDPCYELLADFHDLSSHAVKDCKPYLT